MDVPITIEPAETPRYTLPSIYFLEPVTKTGLSHLIKQMKRNYRHWQIRYPPPARRSCQLTPGADGSTKSTQLKPCCHKLVNWLINQSLLPDSTFAAVEITATLDYTCWLTDKAQLTLCLKFRLWHRWSVKRLSCYITRFGSSPFCSILISASVPISLQIFIQNSYCRRMVIGVIPSMYR
jgi:hypothetical protein